VKRFAQVLCCLSLFAACGGDGRDTYVLTFVGEADPGEPLAGVAIQIDGRPAGKTRADGRLRVAVKNKPGVRVKLSAVCPDGYQSARIAQTVPLRHLRSLDGNNEQTEMRIPIACAPTHRVAAIVIRAAGQANLPILVNGRELGRTDKDGIAHIQVRSLPYRNLRVLLNTADLPHLMPQDPELSFAVEDKDAIFVFDQPFEDKKAERKPGKRPVKIRRPIKIS
jgi:hypothetical protein